MVGSIAGVVGGGGMVGTKVALCVVLMVESVACLVGGGSMVGTTPGV